MDASERFSDLVLKGYDDPGSIELSKSVTAEGRALESGHPAFADLAVGDRRSSRVASLFLDLSDFTGRTYWDPPDEVARLADAVLSGFTWIVTQLGGHVLGLRGDGLFAGFGPTASPGATVVAAGLAAAGALDSVQRTLNPRLISLGIEPVKARAGIDFGEVVFVRSGTSGVNEVNIVGFSANFAAKAEKIANAWEVVVGEGFVDLLGNDDLVSAHDKSPKEFNRNYERKFYRFYQYDWRRTLTELEGAIADQAGIPLETTY